ncbi:MAG TPA: hypothetical protein PLN19_05455 [Methanothrix sp.]|nr:hypothetical protein [Methanothrix sp.]HOV82328.1 hypothetical protein [Methanothrix sp.]HPC89925.1 hypothetical protein [Methanothrix sp.]HQE87705.1 hypothetical protein [Methanothrix sp.]HQI68227.1 hypothetical protein [Methanothrix sp.]
MPSQEASQYALVWGRNMARKLLSIETKSSLTTLPGGKCKHTSFSCCSAALPKSIFLHRLLLSIIGIKKTVPDPIMVEIF